MYRILSIDGGGIRGMISARLLERLYKAFPGWLDKTDLFVGTSAGGITALGLALGRKPSDVIDFFEKNGKTIFRRTVTDRIFRNYLICSKYDNKTLKELISDFAGNTKLKDLSKRVLISSFDLDNGCKDADRSWNPKFYHNFPGAGSDGDELVVDVALRTSAAPSFFPIYQGFVDGGVVANNPSMCGVAQAVNPSMGGQNLDSLLVMSVGSGVNVEFIPNMSDAWGLMQWAPNLLNVLMAGDIKLANYQCKQLIGDRFFRLDVNMRRSVNLDDAEDIKYLEDITDACDLSYAQDWIKSKWLV